MPLNSVNQYCLNNITRLSETHAIEASADIFDENGTKLWAKGNRVSADMQEKLLRRKLAKPLEATLTVDGALTITDIVAACRTHLEQNPLFGRIVNREALVLLDDLKGLPLPEPLRLLLTSIHKDGSSTFRHTIATLLVSAGIAARLGVTQQESQNLMLATLFHDLGEIYINPDYLKSAYRLGPHEWKHVASHPLIGKVLIEELTELPATVALCVAHHHERLDGSGYPQQSGQSKQQRIDGWLAIADTVAAILSRSDGGAPLRVALALRLVPEEFDRTAVAVVIKALRNGDDSFGGEKDHETFARAGETWAQLHAATAASQALLSGVANPFVKQTAAAACALLSNMGKSLRATGCAEEMRLDGESLDQELHAEVCLVVKEVGWRMRNLARNIYLRAEGCHCVEGDECLKSISPLIEALDGKTMMDVKVPA